MFNKLFKINGEIRHKKNTSEESQQQQTYCIPVVKENDRIKEASPDALKKDPEISKDKGFQDLKIGEVLYIPVGRIRPNPCQPRHYFNEESIKGLAQSIKEKGLLQPIIVRATETDYQLIAGERRLKAAIMLGWETIPSILKNNISPNDLKTLSLIENLQREDLSVLDKAAGFYSLKNETVDVKTTAGILCVSEKTVDRYLKIAKTVSLIPEIGEVIKYKNLDFSESFRICQLGDDLAKIKEQDPEKFSSMIQGLNKGKASSAVDIRMRKRKGSMEVQKSEKFKRKNFWSTKTEVGLNLKVNIIDAQKPEVRSYMINEVSKFLDAIGVKFESHERL